MLSAALLARAHRVQFESGTLRYSAIGLATVMTWLLVGELGIAMRDRALMPTSLEVLNRYSATDHQVSMLLSGIPAVLSLFVSPLIGPASDRFRSRWGRRRPFLMLLAPVGGLALLGIAGSASAGALLAAIAGPGADQNDYALTVFAICWSLFSGVMLCVQALYAGLINDVLPREWLGRFFGLYRTVSLAIGIAFYLWVFPLLDQSPYMILVLIALLFTGMIMAMCMMVREGDYPAPVAASGPALNWAERARSLMAGAWSLPHAGWMYGALILGGLSFGPFNTFSQYYAASLGISKTELGQLSSMAYGVSMALALLIGIMVDRIGAVRMSLLVMAAYSMAIGAGYAMLHDANAFRTVYLLHVVLSGAYFTAAAALPMALFPRLDFLRYCAFRDLLGATVGISLSLAQGAVLDRTNHDYRLTLLFAAACGALCAICLGRLAWERNTLAPGR